MARGNRRKRRSPSSSKSDIITPSKRKKNNNSRKRKVETKLTTQQNGTPLRRSSRLKRTSSSSSIEIIGEQPCATPAVLARYKKLVLDSALFLTSPKSARRKQSHISVITISSGSSLQSNGDNLTTDHEERSTENLEISNSEEREDQVVEVGGNKPDQGRHLSMKEHLAGNLSVSHIQEKDEFIEIPAVPLDSLLETCDSTTKTARHFAENLGICQPEDEDDTVEVDAIRSDKSFIKITDKVSDSSNFEEQESLSISQMEEENLAINTHKVQYEEESFTSSTTECAFKPVWVSTPEQNQTQPNDSLSSNNTSLFKRPNDCSSSLIYSSFLLNPMPNSPIVQNNLIPNDPFSSYYFGSLQTNVNTNNTADYLQEQPQEINSEPLTLNGLHFIQNDTNVDETLTFTNKETCATSPENKETLNHTLINFCRPFDQVPTTSKDHGSSFVSEMKPTESSENQEFESKGNE